jgi:hypothetical protein
LEIDACSVVRRKMATLGPHGGVWLAAPPVIARAPLDALTSRASAARPAAKGGWERWASLALPILAGAGPLLMARRSSRRRQRAMVHLKATHTEVQTDVDTSAEEFLIDWQEAMEPPEFQWARRRTRHEADLMAAQAVEARLASFNVGFMFLKPHANTEASRDFVRKQLRKAGIDVLREGSIDAESISSGRLIDRHYGSMAAKAVDTDPAELVVPEAAQVQFAECFGLTWREALDRGLVCNALDATQRLKCTEHELDDKWTPLQLGEGKVKLGGGCYCGKIDGIFVINAFYMAMRQAYVEAVNCRGIMLSGCG